MPAHPVVKGSGALQSAQDTKRQPLAIPPQQFRLNSLARCLWAFVLHALVGMLSEQLAAEGKHLSRQPIPTASAREP